MWLQYDSLSVQTNGDGGKLRTAVLNQAVYSPPTILSLATTTFFHVTPGP